MTATGKSGYTGLRIIRRARSRGFSFYLVEVIVWALMIAVALYELLPVMWMFSTSLRLPGESYELPPSFFPTSWNWKNYASVLRSEQIDYPRFFYNSVKLAGINVAAVLLTCSLAGFSFARLRYKGRDLFFFLFLASMMVPAQVYVIPLFIIVRNLGLIDTHLAIILPALTSSLGVFLIRQYFLTLPGELFDSAKIDGAGYFRVYWQIMMPLVGPGLSALAILTFMGQWNNFFGPLLFLRSWEKLTLPIALVTLEGYMGSGSRSEVLAAIMLSIFPVLVFFLIAQRYVVEGIALTGLKG
ncbi:MAG: carbohydrate ABC transporter permease [Chloroflexi bacterium]|nr:carbohydrate ABC transporter permease [Chloroflexota bacterium]